MTHSTGDKKYNPTLSTLNVKQEEPLNAEPKTVSSLVEAGWLTPVELIFKRNHGPIPAPPLDPDSYTFNVQVESQYLSHLDRSSSGIAKGKGKEDLGSEGIVQSRRDLKGWVAEDPSNREAEVYMTLQCAGNRRDEMSERLKTEGLGWGNSVIANTKWSGALLRPFLLDVLGLPHDWEEISDLKDAHVEFESDQPCEETPHYASSVPLPIALSPAHRILIAYTLNSDPLAPLHGGPLRIIIPGQIGARSVKWLRTIRLRSTESHNFYMQQDYKVLPEHVKDDGQKKEWIGRVPPLEEFGIQCVVGVPADGDVLDVGGSKVKGYASTGDGKGIRKVEVAVLVLDADSQNLERHELVDRAESEGDWQEAKLLRNEEGGDTPKVPGGLIWSWTLWEIEVDVKEEWKGKEVAFICRAEDSDGRKQIKLSPWNLRGVENNGWHVVKDLHVR